MDETASRLSLLEGKEGKYHLVMRSTKTVVDPGESVLVQLYITGFGTIDYPKLVFYPSANVLSKQSEVSFGAELRDNGLAYFGSQKEKFDQYGKTINLSFVNGHTLFLRNSKSISLQIMTEKNTNDVAPVQLDLRLSSQARPGNYFIHFVLTYFNGEEWDSVSEKFTFTVRNSLQRHELLAWWLGIIAAAATVISAGFALYEFYTRTGG